MNKRDIFLLWLIIFAYFWFAYYLGYRAGRKPNLKKGVWVLIQQTPYGYHVAAITNANTVFATNLNIQEWEK